MAEVTKELVLIRKHESGRFRLRMTPRKAWGICYGALLREMHIDKLDHLPLAIFHDGDVDSVRPVVDVQFNLGNERTIHVDDGGMWIHYGNTYGDVTEPASSETLEEIVSLARWYGPFDQSTYERFLQEARPHEVPHVRMPGLLMAERKLFAELNTGVRIHVTEVF